MVTGKIISLCGIPCEERKIWLQMNKILVTLVLNEQGDRMNATQQKIIEMLEYLEGFSESELYAITNDWKSQIINDGNYEGLARAEAILRLSLLMHKIAA